MLFDIWLHFFPKDKDILDIDQKWRKLIALKLFHY